MISSDALKCVVSDYELTTCEVAPRKPLHLNRFGQVTKGLMWGSLQGTTSDECATTFLFGGCFFEKDYC